MHSFRNACDDRALFRYADEVCRQGMPTGYADKVCRQGMPTSCANRLSQRPYFGKEFPREGYADALCRHTYADNLCRRPMPTTYADNLCRRPMPTPYADNLCRQACQSQCLVKATLIGTRPYIYSSK